MDMKGEYVIAAPRENVWAALNDIDVLKAAIPGCQSISRISETEIEASVTAKVGPVKATFKGVVTLSDLDPPNGYTIHGQGKGGAAGFAKGGAKVRLVDDPDGTRLMYDVDASVAGKLAQIGGRLIASTAKKLADEFFARLSELAVAMPPEEEMVPLESAADAGQNAETAAPSTAPAGSNFVQKSNTGLWIIIGAAAAIAVLAALFALGLI